MRAYRVASVMEAFANDARKSRSDAEGLLADMRSRQMMMQEQIRAAYQQMARLLMQESPDVGELQNIQGLLNQLQREIQSTRDDLARSEVTLQERQARRLSVQEQIDQLLAERDKRLEETPDAHQAYLLMNQLQGDVDTLAHDHHELENEVQEKQREYAAARLFMFLLRRKFGQPDYRAWPVARNLDAWLARTIRFNDNLANYQMLGALLSTSERRLSAARAALEERAAQHQSRVAAIEEQLQLPLYYQRQKSSEEELSASMRHIADLQTRLAQYAQGTGPLFDAIAQQLSQQIAQMPHDRLELMVGKTASPEDDRLLGTVQQLKRDAQDIDGQIRTQELSCVAVRTQAERAEQLVQAFHRNGYNDAQLEYDWGFFNSPEKLFTSYLRGNSALNDVMRQLSAIARRRPSGGGSLSFPSTGGSSGSIFGSSSPRSSGGGGGFHTSSSSGGGGFRTTDRF
ncbi:hypothetical protein [Enterobacillus tribolii]|uniref:Uncharacterized protein n=1 Tax=Enterobacillus tribolii TaxID=1487935 RepID=A0A370R4V5_9GAMM|nr:hypothetical protein [Enterobacillus tribolii]MBW7983383.1 hypothetical protein [Enterobacillus tribolii]RDK97443.1 hypothetical protein C8D90_101893 [Enterobacillus tribolii]